MPVLRGALRLAAALLLPLLLIGGLLLMHGLSAPHHGDGAAEAAGSHEDDHPCLECRLGHGLMVCVAVVASLVGLRPVRRLVARLRATRSPGSTAFGQLMGFARPVFRPPRPVWVQLSVMRC